MKKLIMLITAISLLPAYIFAAGDVMEDKTLGEKISKKIEDVKKQKIEKENMKTPAYIGMRKYMEEDDGDGLRKYIANYHKSGKHITEDDFYDIYDVKKKEGRKPYKRIKEHKLCYAIAYNKVNVGKAIIDAGQYPKEGCRRYVNKKIDYYDYHLVITKEEVPLWKGVDIWDGPERDKKYTVSKNAELTCYALEKGVIPREWLLNDKLPAPALCKEEWELPLKILKKKKAEEEARAKAEAEAKALAERARMLAEMGVSEEKWQKLIEQSEDEFSFAKQSMDVLSKLIPDDKELYHIDLDETEQRLPENEQLLIKKKKFYQKLIKDDLDNAYKKYVGSLAGGSVPKKAKENYEFTKQILKNGCSSCEAQIKSSQEQRYYNNMLAAFEGNEERAKYGFKLIEKLEELEKDVFEVNVFDKKAKFKAMYFPEGAIVNYEDEEDRTGTHQFEYINPVYVFMQRRDGFTYKTKNMYYAAKPEVRKFLFVFNSKGELVKKIYGWYVDAFEAYDRKDKNRNIKIDKPVRDC